MTQSSSTRTSSEPSGKFSSPEEVVEARHLSPDERRSLLQHWRDQVDARGKHGDVHEADLTIRLARALSFLDTETGEHEVTHNQGLYTSVRDAGKDQER
jgi:hypothetical protein